MSDPKVPFTVLGLLEAVVGLFQSGTHLDQRILPRDLQNAEFSWLDNIPKTLRDESEVLDGLGAIGVVARDVKDVVEQFNGESVHGSLVCW